MADSPGTHSGRELADSHAGLLVAAGIAALGILKLLALAEWETETAAAILQHVGTTEVVLGTVIASAHALVIPALWMPLVVTAYLRSRDGAWPRVAWLRVLTIFLTPIALAFGAVIMSFLMLLVITGFAVWLGRTDRRMDPVAARRGTLAVVVSVSISAVAGTFIYSGDAGWLPHESVRSDEQAAFTAYVLSGDEASGWIVLRNEPRRVEVVPADAQRERTLCDPSSDWFTRSIADILEGRSTPYPDCP